MSVCGGTATVADSRVGLWHMMAWASAAISRGATTNPKVQLSGVDR
jgi:hypothetical protein